MDTLQLKTNNFVIPKTTFFKKTFNCPNCNKSKIEILNLNVTCKNCKKKFKLQNNTVILQKKKDSFYEGKYEGKIKFSPKKENFFSSLGLWIINNGYLWHIKKRFNFGDFILEIGTGCGADFLGDNYNTVGVDLSSKSLSKLNYKYAVQTSITETLPFKDKSFDCIAGSFIWEHIPDDLKPVSLREFRRILNDNGKLILLFDIDTKNPIWSLIKKKNYKLFKKLFIENDKHLGFSTLNKNLKIFKDSNFLVENIYGNEKTFFQSMNTYEKIFAFFPSLNFANTLFKKINVKFLYYGYTMFLRVIDCLTHVIIPNKYSRTILIVLKKN